MSLEFLVLNDLQKIIWLLYLWRITKCESSFCGNLYLMTLKLICSWLTKKKEKKDGDLDRIFG